MKRDLVGFSLILAALVIPFANSNKIKGNIKDLMEIPHLLANVKAHYRKDLQTAGKIYQDVIKKNTSRAEGKSKF
uniref:Uncharacterized protein n=1 Tax=Glossina palpalis gambiensis TaxID=67801 RepID=A0A1B0AR53_9MUSC